MSGRRILAGSLLVLGVAFAGAALAAPAEDRILGVEQYTSEKARRLARTFDHTLRDLNAEIYHCMPWVEVQKQTIGFFHPKHLASDERYLSIRLYIEQDPSPQFARLTVEDRASGMFSRYVGPILRRMTQDRNVLTDPAVDGFTIILEWLKQVPTSRDARPIHETIAVFIQRPLALEYVAGRATIPDLAAQGRVLGFDGETALGALTLAAWDDNFVATYKVANYQLERGVTCGRF